MGDYTPQIGESSKELERLIRHGRNFGCTFIFNTLRPAYLNKNVLNLIDVVVFFRLVWERDILVVKDILNNLGKRNITSEVQAITNFGVGECKVYKFGIDTKNKISISKDKDMIDTKISKDKDMIDTKISISKGKDIKDIKTT